MKRLVSLKIRRKNGKKRNTAQRHADKTENDGCCKYKKIISFLQKDIDKISTFIIQISHFSNRMTIQIYL